MIDKLFRLRENGTSLKTEIGAGLATFLTMAYIIFVQPQVLSRTFDGKETGLDFGAVMLATCLASALGTIAMGLYARYPVALAPGMGENFFFVSVIMYFAARNVSNPHQIALGITFIYGVIFLVLVLLGMRKAVVDALSPNMKHALAVGIGLFIAFIGLQHAGLIVGAPGTLLKLNPDLSQPSILIFFFGLFVIMALEIRKVPGSMIIGILSAAAFAIVIGQVEYKGIFGLPEVGRSAFLQMDLPGALTLTALPFIFIFLFMDVFDTVGTLIGVGEQAGLVRDNQLPRVREALIVDSGSAALGACLGTSTVTCYIESAAGISQGGRTGLTSVATGVLFLLALFLWPLVSMVGNNLAITAPALVVVGAMMMRNTARIDWADHTEALPAFLVIMGIPLSYSIANGLALGFISYPIVKILGGKARQVSWLMYAMAVILIIYLIRVHARLGA